MNVQSMKTLGTKSSRFLIFCRRHAGRCNQLVKELFLSAYISNEICLLIRFMAGIEKIVLTSFRKLYLLDQILQVFMRYPNLNKITLKWARNKQACKSKGYDQFIMIKKQQKYYLIFYCCQKSNNTLHLTTNVFT